MCQAHIHLHLLHQFTVQAPTTDTGEERRAKERKKKHWSSCYVCVNTGSFLEAQQINIVGKCNCTHAFSMRKIFLRCVEIDATTKYQSIDASRRVRVCECRLKDDVNAKIYLRHD